MKAKDVEAGKVYAVKVSGRIAPVRLDGVSSGTGRFFGTNLRTGRRLTGLTPARCRAELVPYFRHGVRKWRYAQDDGWAGRACRQCGQPLSEHGLEA